MSEHEVLATAVDASAAAAAAAGASSAAAGARDSSPRPEQRGHTRMPSLVGGKAEHPGFAEGPKGWGVMLTPLGCLHHWDIGLGGTSNHHPVITRGAFFNAFDLSLSVPSRYKVPQLERAARCSVHVNSGCPSRAPSAAIRFIGRCCLMPSNAASQNASFPKYVERGRWLQSGRTCCRDARPHKLFLKWALADDLTAARCTRNASGHCCVNTCFFLLLLLRYRGLLLEWPMRPLPTGRSIPTIHAILKRHG